MQCTAHSSGYKWWGESGLLLLEQMVDVEKAPTVSDKRIRNISECYNVVTSVLPFGRSRSTVHIYADMYQN